MFRCRTDEEPTKLYFGIVPKLRAGRKSAYAELFDVLHGSTVLIRQENKSNPADKKLLKTDDFIDAGTTWCTVFAILYSPQEDMVTLLQIGAASEGGRSITPFASIEFKV